jgi:hypothetical protein
MILMCAWCKETIQDLSGSIRDHGPRPTRWSCKEGIVDGICLDCRKSFFPETLRTVQENAQATLRDCLRAIGGNVSA